MQTTDNPADYSSILKPRLNICGPRPPLYLSPFQGERSACLTAVRIDGTGRSRPFVERSCALPSRDRRRPLLFPLKGNAHCFLPLKGGGSRWGSRVASTAAEIVPSLDATLASPFAASPRSRQEPPAEIRRDRSGRDSSPSSTPPRSPWQTSPLRRRTHRPRRRRAAVNANRRSGRRACRST